MDAMPMTEMVSPAVAAVRDGSPQTSAERRDAAEVAALDTAFQAAVKRNDVATMERILHPRYALILGDGRLVSRNELIAEARDRTNDYEIQDEDAGTQQVRIWGDSAIVTARLRIKGTADNRTFDRTLWFSDTYVRTPRGWLYAFGQASLPLPPR